MVIVSMLGRWTVGFLGLAGWPALTSWEALGPKERPSTNKEKPSYLAPEGQPCLTRDITNEEGGGHPTPLRIKNVNSELWMLQKMSFGKKNKTEDIFRLFSVTWACHFLKGMGH